MTGQAGGKQEPVEDVPVAVEAGETSEKQSWGTVNVSNSAGRARRCSSASSPVSQQSRGKGPKTVWQSQGLTKLPTQLDPARALYTLYLLLMDKVLATTFVTDIADPDNTKLFRDIQAVGQRRVVSTAPCHKVIEVEQLQELKVLWIRKTFSTWLHVEEDCRNPDHMVVTFDLLKSDVLSRFHGRWDIRSVRDASGAVVATEATLNQDVLPRGIPPFLKHIPVAGDLMRAVTMRAIKRVMEDVDAVVRKIKAGLAKGVTIQETLRALCGVCQEAGHANGAVASFAFDGSADADSEDDEQQPDTDSDAVASKASTDLTSAQGSNTSKEKVAVQHEGDVKEVTEGIDTLHVHAGLANGAPAYDEPTVLPATVRVAASS